jgi:hypothetical protein
MTRNIQQPNTNSVSTQIVEVPTAAGFSAGDLVYFNNGDYKAGTSLTASSAVFGNTPVPSSIPGVLGTNLINVNPSGVQSGAGTKNCAALLTNGNIVQVYINYTNGTPYFQIVDNTQSTIVVAATQISATFTNGTYSNISVVALTGGGFAVLWMNAAGGTANYPCYAVYTNTGSVTKAAAQDTAAGTSGNYTYPGTNQIVALPNGGFSICYANASTFATLYLRGYDATGTAAYTWQSITGFTSLNYGFGLTATSFNNVVVHAASVTSGSMRYAMYSYAGTAVVAATNYTPATSGTSGAVLGMDVTVLADGTSLAFGFVIALADGASNKYTAFFRLATSTSTAITLGTEYYIPPSNNPNSTSLYSSGPTFTLLPFSGGFIIFATAAAGSNAYNTLLYSVFNASGTCISGLGASNASSGAAWHIIGQQVTAVPSGNVLAYKLGIVEITSLNTAYIYYQAETYNTLCYTQYAFKFNTSSYLLNYNMSSTQNIATVYATPSTAVSGTLTPTSVSFYGSGGVSNPAVTASTVKGLTNISTTSGSTYALRALCCTTLSNGNYAVGYYGSSTGTIYIATISQTGSILSNVNTNISGYLNSSGANFYSAFKICGLTSGKIALGVMNSSNSSVYVYLFNSSLTQIGSVQLAPGGSTSIVTGIAVTALTNDRFVVCAGNGASFNYAVYGNTGATNVASGTAATTDGNTISQVGCVGTSDGGFIMSGTTGSGYLNTVFVANTTGNTFVVGTVAAPSVGTSAVNGIGVGSAGAGLNGYMYYIMWDGSTTITQYNLNKLGSATTTGSIATASYTFNTIANNGTSICLTNTGYGTPVVVLQATNGSLAFWGNLGGANTTNASTVYQSSIFGRLSGNILSATPGPGNNILVATLDNNSYPSFAIVNVPPATASWTSTEWVPTTTTTASAVPSSIVPVGSATGNVNNTVLAGVAATTAAAGTVGQLVINGPAQLNANYSNSITGNFDFTGQAISGVRGTYNGRLINMQGNT